MSILTRFMEESEVRHAKTFRAHRHQHVAQGRFITDEVIIDVHNTDTSTAQEANKNEIDRASRLDGYAEFCSGVYDDTLMYQFIRSLLW